MYVYIYIYTHYVCIYIYIYIYMYTLLHPGATPPFPCSADGSMADAPPEADEGGFIFYMTISPSIFRCKVLIYLKIIKFESKSCKFTLNS